MSSLLASMSPEQRRQLMELSEQLLADFDLNWQMSQLGHNLRDLFPDEAWDRIRNVEGVDPLQLGQALDSLRDLEDLDDLIRMLSGAPQPGALADVDLDRVRDLVGEEAARSIDQLAQLASRLEREGLVERRDGQLELSARGLRRLGQSALAEVFRKLRKDLTGSHEVGLVGFGHERTYESKPFEWGDPFQVDLHRTLHEAIRRRASMGETMSGRINLIPEDFVIEQTELSTRAATVLMLDLSLSMPMRDNFLPAKKVAIALHSLISSMYPRDFFGMVVFSESAEVIEPRRLPSVMWDYVYGTNMEHGFRLARRMLARESGEKQILMITDGEPTAHINEYGVPEFHYPPIRRTVDLTMTEVIRCTRAGIRINTFMLDADHGLVRFIEQLTELNGGRVFHVDRDNLGDFVLVDFVEHRSKRVRARR